MFQTPVLIIAYKRPTTTKLVFNAIREIKPTQLYIFADGPKNSDELELCNETRLILSEIDWICDVKTYFSEKNLGSALGPKSALDWFFEHTEKGVIIEDDILASRDFFFFCETLLNYYEHNEKVMHISGMNFHGKKKFTNNSYYFSKVISPWGWATWKRAWEKYDFSLHDLETELSKIDLPEFYKVELQNIKNGLLSTWDYQWLYSVIKNNGIGIVPANNLVLNIGFDMNATNTQKAPDWVKNCKIESLKSIKHPDKIELNKKADDYTFSIVIPHTNKNDYYSRLKRFITNCFR